jgi:hypothetical protein
LSFQGDDLGLSESGKKRDRGGEELMMNVTGKEEAIWVVSKEGGNEDLRESKSRCLHDRR